MSRCCEVVLSTLLHCHAALVVCCFAVFQSCKFACLASACSVFLEQCFQEFLDQFQVATVLPCCFLANIPRLKCIASLRDCAIFSFWRSTISAGILPTNELCHNPYTAVRVGEALHPGPEPLCLNFAVTNPTSIVSKPGQYAELIQECALDVFSASETAATKAVQRQFATAMRHVGFRSKWSVPLADRVVRSDGQPSLRGKASGVGLFSSWPIRTLSDTIDEFHAATSRLGHFLLEIDKFQLQIVVIYGNAMSGSVRANQLLLQAALNATSHFDLPYVIMGDYNADPYSLLPDELRDRNLVDLRKIYTKLHGGTMPATCKSVTSPDNALFSPLAASWVTKVCVLPPGHFDAHNVVTFQLTIPGLTFATKRISLPKSWIDLPIESQFLAQSYDIAVAALGVPHCLEEWGQTVEYAVDHAYRCTQLRNEQVPWHRTKPLPKQFRGRCQPRQPQSVPKKLLTKPGRPGDYSPPGEIIRRVTQARIKQVRRVQSLYRRVTKAQTYHPTATVQSEMQQEWNAILRCKAFDGCQIRWCQNMPELGPPPMFVPQVDYLGTMLELLRYQTDMDVAFDRKIHKDRLTFAQDLDQRFAGHRAAFASVREFSMPPLLEMQKQLAEDAILVPHADDHVIAYCDHADLFDLAAPVMVHDVPCRIVSRDEYSLQLKWPRHQDVPEQSVLTQTLTKADPCSMLAMLKDFWLPIWYRPDPPAEAAEVFQQFVASLPVELPAPAIDMQDAQMWKLAVRELKVPSARGIDAISSQELKQLPDAAISHVASIINAQEHGFPSWLMTAITVAIPKVASVPEPSQIRPITVLGQLYRLWSRVICKQLLAHMASHFPHEVCGFLAHRGPVDSYMHQQWMIERAYHMQQHRAGITADLLKCFNTICPAAVLHVFTWMGFPPSVTNQWYASLSKLCRVWKVGQDFSAPIQVNHGCPEGDSWSVVSILALAYVWIRLAKRDAASCQLAAYADNWTWSANTTADHQSLLTLTVNYVASAGMQIDWRKTWAWATSPQQFAMLADVLQAHPEAAAVPRCQNAMDLGAQMTYQGVPNLGKFRARLEKVHDRLLRLQRIPHSLNTKIRLVKGAIYPAAYYGAEILPLGDSHSKKLRTAISNALLGPSSSRNAALAISAMPGLLDPFLELMLRVFSAARRMLLRMSTQQRALFFRMVARHSGLSYQCHGPAGVLAFYLSKLGWQLDVNGTMHVHAFCKLPLLTTGRKQLVRWLQYAWDSDVLLHACDRKGVPRFVPLNSEDTRAVVAKFPDHDRYHILQELSGSFQTESQKMKWAPDSTGYCRTCQAWDDRYHRVYDCPATDHVREPYLDTLRFFQDAGAEFHELPFVLRHPQYDALLALQYCCPAAQIDDAMLSRLRGLNLLGFPVNLYTDGSLMHPATPSCRYGSFALVLDTSLNDAQRMAEAKTWLETGLFPPSLVRLAMARTQGPQTIYRSEFLAVLTAAEWFDDVVIHTDCQSVIRVWDVCVTATDFSCLHACDNLDLVERLWTALQVGNKSFHKVKAHVEDFTGLDLLTVFHSLGNRLANDVAIQACKHFQPEPAILAEEIFADLTQFQHHLQRLFQMFLDLRVHHAKSAELQKETELHSELRPDTGPSPLEVLANWSFDEVWSPPSPGITMLQYSAWGKPLCNTVVAWMHEVRWPLSEEIHPDDPGVSWPELVISYTLHSGIILPVKRLKPDGTEYLQLFDSWDSARTFEVGLSELAHTFSNLTLQVRKLHANDPWPNRPLGFVRSLYRLGARNQPAGVKCRPTFPCQQQTCEILHRYLLQHKGYDTLPVIPMEVKAIDGRTCCQTWPQGLKLAAKGFQKIKEWKKAPTGRLCF